MRTLASPFKSSKGEAAFLAAYAASMRLWPVPYESMYVQSRFGRTHVVTSGERSAPPLVLLHAYGVGSPMWCANIEALSQRHRIYAVDVIGQAGKSIPGQPLRSRAEYVEWLTAILDGLRLPKADIAGASFGGWLALNFAIATPDRVGRIVLLSPAGSFVPLRKRFFIEGFLLAVVPSRLIFRNFYGWFFSYRNVCQDKRLRDLFECLREQMYLGMRHFRTPPNGVLPAVFSDNELRSVRVPTLLMIGQEEALYDAMEALARANRLMPNLQGQLVANANHEMVISRHDIVDARILEFLAASAEATTVAA